MLLSIFTFFSPKAKIPFGISPFKEKETAIMTLFSTNRYYTYRLEWQCRYKISQNVTLPNCRVTSSHTLSWIDFLFCLDNSKLSRVEKARLLYVIKKLILSSCPLRKWTSLVFVYLTTYILDRILPFTGYVLSFQDNKSKSEKSSTENYLPLTIL